MNVCLRDFDFLRPLYECDGVQFVERPAEAEFVLTMNQSGLDAEARVLKAADEAHAARKALAWLTIEDPNGYGFTLAQARWADCVFTSDRCLLPNYRQALGHNRVYWLPLAASERLHRPMPLAEGAADFVFSGNWYPWGARKWGDEVLLRPLARAGYSFVCFSYERPPYPELADSWRSLVGAPEGPFEMVAGRGGTSCYTVAEQYRYGRVVLGANNQRSGFDGIERTVMTSMRTFEALACGKPFLAPHSDAYEALGFSQGGCFHWSESAEQTLHWASLLAEYAEEAELVAETGRAFVLANHTYRHRLERMARALKGEADPEDWH